MKRCFITLVLLGMLVSVFANPIATPVLSRFWFDAEGLLHLQYSPHLSFLSEQSAVVYDGTNYYTNTYDFSNENQPVTAVLDCPNIGPQYGFLSVTVADITDEVHWGPSFENDLCSLFGTQCAVQVLVTGWDSSYWMWAKDISPTAGYDHYPSVGSTIDVACFDFSGAPVSDVPIYYNTLLFPHSSTLADGHDVIGEYSTKTRIMVKHPQTNETVCDTTFFAEPGQTYPINVYFYHVANEDPYTPVARGNFSIYPTVIHTSDSQSLHMKYDAKLNADTWVELYDIKGRFLAKQAYQEGGTDWSLPENLSSGVYFLRLNSNKQNLGNQKLIILK
jgi:hypothetical protein